MKINEVNVKGFDTDTANVVADIKARYPHAPDTMSAILKYLSDIKDASKQADTSHTKNIDVNRDEIDDIQAHITALQDRIEELEKDEDVRERSLTPGEKRGKEAHFKKLKKHKGDFTDRYGKEGESIMHAIATKRAKGESIEEVTSPSKEFGMFTPGGDAQIENGINHILRKFTDQAIEGTEGDRDALRMAAHKTLLSMLEDMSEEEKYEEAMDTDVRERAAAYLEQGILRVYNMLDYGSKMKNEGWEELPPINREKYGKRDDLEGPIQTRSGKTVYYDPKAGSYYDPDTDMYISYDDWKKLDSKGMYKMDKMTSRHDNVPEAVGDAAEAFYRLQDEFAGEEARGAHKILIDELVRYLSGDQIADFVEDFRRHHMDESVNESKLTEGVLDDADEDGWMAKSQLYKTAKYAIGLHGMISDTDNLEPWVQAKITRASEDLSSVKHYMEYEAMSPQAVQAQPEQGPVQEAEDEKHYMCVHATKGTMKCTANTSYEAAKKAAAQWKMKSTAGIDAHLMEGHSPHKKGSAKYKKHMAAKHAAMAEDKDSARMYKDNPDMMKKGGPGGYKGLDKAGKKAVKKAMDEGAADQLEKQAIDFFTSIKSKINTTGKK